jgi:class 3 adenylate cyclase
MSSYFAKSIVHPAAHGLVREKRIEFRVGIHIGDVVEEEDGDLMGDGVNIAAWLGSFAKPGGIARPRTPTDK